MTEIPGQHELLTVTDNFQISGQGLAVVPDFSVPSVPWQTSTSAVVVKPGGEQIVATLILHLTHFNIRDRSESMDRRWRVVPTFPTLTKEDVPVGSRVFVDLITVAALKGDVA